MPAAVGRQTQRRRGVPAKTDQPHNETAGNMGSYPLNNKKSFHMDTNSSRQKGDPTNRRPSKERIPESITPHHHEVNITDGGEFLDDAIRMKDQPIEEANKEPSPVSYKHLF
jgi:hypothetical protein